MTQEIKDRIGEKYPIQPFSIMHGYELERDAAEWGYSLAAPEIEELKAEIERLKSYNDGLKDIINSKPFNK